MIDHDARCALVVERLAITIDSVLPTGPLSRTADELIAGVRRTLSSNLPQDVLSVHVPLAFADPNQQPGVDDDMVGVAAACSALHVGARLLDDLMDGHDISYFESAISATDVLIWALFLSTLPPLALARLDVEPQVRIRVVDDMTVGMAEMASGQLGDVDPDSEIPTAAQAMATVEGKTGAVIGTYARCSARAAGFDDDQVDTATRFGRSLGIGRQLVADGAKIMTRPDRRSDQVSPTWVIAVHAESLAGDERTGFEELVARARIDNPARLELAEQIRESPALVSSAVAAEFHLSAALAATESLAEVQGIRSALSDMVDAMSDLGVDATR